MKSNLVAVALVVVFFLGALSTAILAINYHNTVNTQIRLNTSLAQMQRTAGVMQSIAAECLEYSKRNPAKHNRLPQQGDQASAPACLPSNRPRCRIIQRRRQLAERGKQILERCRVAAFPVREVDHLELAETEWRNRPVERDR